MSKTKVSPLSAVKYLINLQPFHKAIAKCIAAVQNKVIEQKGRNGMLLSSVKSYRKLQMITIG